MPDAKPLPGETRKDARSTAASAIPRVSTRELLADSREIEIEHKGALYRLRETAQGKLILTK